MDSSINGWLKLHLSVFFPSQLFVPLYFCHFSHSCSHQILRQLSRQKLKLPCVTQCWYKKRHIFKAQMMITTVPQQKQKGCGCSMNFSISLPNQGDGCIQQSLSLWRESEIFMCLYFMFLGH